MESKVLFFRPGWLAMAVMLALGSAGCNYYPGLDDDCQGDDCPLFEDGPVIVDIVTALADPAGGYVLVSLRDHADVRVDVEQVPGVHVGFLEFSQRYEAPLYLEIDPETRVILEVLVPYDSPVHSLNDRQTGVEVQLIYSAAIHYLDRTHPDFEQMHTDLRASEEDGHSLLVTETREEHVIIDVRPPLRP